MLGRATVAMVAVVLAGCGSGGPEGNADKRVRQGATASVVGDLVWVAGGAEGTMDQSMQGVLDVSDEVVAYGLDGEEVSSVQLDLGGGEGLVEAAVVEVGDRRLLTGGRCVTNGFGCNGSTAPFVAWVSDDDVEAVELAEAEEGPIRVLGVVDDVAWLLVNPFAPLLGRADPDTGEIQVSELPPFAFTGGTCAGPDGVVAGVADRDEEFAALGLELLRRGAGADDGWRSVGTVTFDAPRNSRIDLHCLGGGEVLVSFREEDRRAMVVTLDGARVLADPPEALQGALTAAVDRDSATAVVTALPRNGPTSAYAHRPGGDWKEVGTVVTPAPALGVVDGEVVEGGGVAAVVGAAAARVGRLPS